MRTAFLVKNHILQKNHTFKAAKNTNQAKEFGSETSTILTTVQALASILLDQGIILVTDMISVMKILRIILSVIVVMNMMSRVKRTKEKIQEYFMVNQDLTLFLQMEDILEREKSQAIFLQMKGIQESQMENQSDQAMVTV
uniref:Uncharacterized protein n=1 Tax=Cacopsylla melanoneura TaxID=428564 RepID=A0A8D8XD86_9HEMI